MGLLAIALVAAAHAGLSDPNELPATALPAIEHRPWAAIVVHHSAGPSGSAGVFHRWHLQRGWDGLGYHFVIGNGNGAGDGVVEPGWRWVAQREGAHAGQREHNDRGIGICLVGNFETSEPTEAQYRALVELCSRLMLKYGIDADRIVGHRHVKPTTLCPGKRFPLERLRKDLREG